MPKLKEYFSPITKPSMNNVSTLPNVIAPVPIHANSTCNILDQSETTNARCGNDQ